MNEKIKEGWHQVLRALMQNDVYRADSERAWTEYMARCQRAQVQLPKEANR